MKKVQILMSVYNGQQYLSLQIESIMEQKDVDVYLVIRDDGSNDDSKKIISYYEKKYSNKIKVYFEDNIGVKKSFLKLVELSDENMDFYAFSDQDDIWEKDKLICAINKLTNRQQPEVYGSNVKLFFDDNIEIIRNVFNKQLKVGNFLVKSFFPGCTIVFNKCMRTLVLRVSYLELQDFPLHDHWLCLVCTSCGGKIFYDKEAHILYRQHDSNVIGYRRGLLNKVKQNGLFSKEQRRYKIAFELQKHYMDFFDDTSRNIIKKIVEYQDNLKNRIIFMMEKRISSENFFQDMVIKILILLKRF